MLKRGSTTATIAKKPATEAKSTAPLTRTSAMDSLKKSAGIIFSEKATTTRSPDALKKELEELNAINSLAKLIGKVAETIIPLAFSSKDQKAKSLREDFKNAVKLLEIIDKNEAASEPQQKTLQENQAKLSIELTTALKISSEFKAELEKTQLQKSAIETEAKNSKEQLATATTKIDAAEKEKLRLEKELKNSQNTVEERDRTIARINHQLEELKQQLAAAQKKYEDLNTRFFQTTDENLKLNSKVAELTNRLDLNAETYAAKIENMTIRHSTQEERLQSLTNQLNATQQELMRQSVPATPVSMRYSTAGGPPPLHTQRLFYKQRGNVNVPATPSSFLQQMTNHLTEAKTPQHQMLDRRSSVPATEFEKFVANQSTALKPATTLTGTPGAERSKADTARHNFDTYFTAEFNTAMKEIQKNITLNPSNTELVKTANDFRFEFIKLYADMKQTKLPNAQSIIRHLVDKNSMYNTLLLADIDCKAEDRAKKLAAVVGGQKVIYTVLYQAYFFGVVSGATEQTQYFFNQRATCDKPVAASENGLDLEKKGPRS